MRIVWTERARTTAARFLADQAGMLAIGTAVAALVEDPHPQESFAWGRYRRLRVGDYRVMYEADSDAGLITIDRVDRVEPGKT